MAVVESRPRPAADATRTGASTPTPASDTEKRCGLRTIECPYCEAEIPASSFTFPFATKRLVRAVCPTCERSVAITALHWQRLSGRLSLVAKDGR
jgi:hypothetical protein